MKQLIKEAKQIQLKPHKDAPNWTKLSELVKQLKQVGTILCNHFKKWKLQHPHCKEAATPTVHKVSNSQKIQA